MARRRERQTRSSSPSFSLSLLAAALERKCSALLGFLIIGLPLSIKVKSSLFLISSPPNLDGDLRRTHISPLNGELTLFCLSNFSSFSLSNHHTTTLSKPPAGCIVFHFVPLSLFVQSWLLRSSLGGLSRPKELSPSPLLYLLLPLLPPIHHLRRRLSSPRPTRWLPPSSPSQQPPLSATSLDQAS